MVCGNSSSWILVNLDFNNLWFSEEIKSYRINKITDIQAKFKALNITLVEDDFDADRYASKKTSKTKGPKKSTVQETFELWQQKNSIKEIAAIRKLTPQTIYGHFAKLIEAEQVQLSAILTEDKIAALSKVFKGFKGESLVELMEKYGLNAAAITTACEKVIKRK